MRLTKATMQAIRYACLHFHYSKAVPVHPIGYNVYNDADEWCGVIIYSAGATPNIGTAYNLPGGGDSRTHPGRIERKAGTNEQGGRYES